METKPKVKIEREFDYKDTYSFYKKHSEHKLNGYLLKAGYL